MATSGRQSGWIRERFRDSVPIKVAFLTFYIEAWDALDEIWRIMNADPRFEVSVYSIPRKLTGDEGFGGEDTVSAFLTNTGLPTPGYPGTTTKPD